jgi:hypothetical protein
MSLGQSFQAIINFRIFGAVSIRTGVAEAAGRSPGNVNNFDIVQNMQDFSVIPAIFVSFWHPVNPSPAPPSKEVMWEPVA